MNVTDVDNGATIRGMSVRSSSDVIVQAPMSFTGSAKRLWRPVRHAGGATKALLAALMVGVIVMAWTAIAVWYLFAFWLMIPYRMIRRGQRRQRRDLLELRESMARQSPSTR